MISNATLPTKLLSPPNFSRTFIAISISVSAAPMAVKPRPTSLQLILPKSASDLAIVLIEDANTPIVIIAEILTFVFPTAFKPLVNMSMLPPMPIRPLITPVKDMSLIVFIASAKISIALATAII